MSRRSSSFTASGSVNGSQKIGGTAITNTAPAFSVAANTVGNQISDVVGIVSNQRVSLTCGDGLTSFGDFNTVTLLIQNVTNNVGTIEVTTSTPHGLLTDMSVTISGVGGVSNANGTFWITKVNATTFLLDFSTFAGSYTSGGTVVCCAITQAVVYWLALGVPTGTICMAFLLQLVPRIARLQ